MYENLMWNLSYIEAQDLCKHQIDLMERWSRRIIDETFIDKYGEGYFDHICDSGEPLIKKDIRDKVEGRINRTPSNFSRRVDALTIEDIEYFFCKECFYADFFKDVFEPFYSGNSEVKCVLNRVSVIRNKIAHGNPLSQRDLEQGVCYSNDLIDVFKSHYLKLGKERVYNVPTFISLTDSFGRKLVRDNSSYSWEVREYMFRDYGLDKELKHLYSGASYRVILEVDSSFPENFYSIEWRVTCGFSRLLAEGRGNTIDFSVDDTIVSFYPEITAKLITKRPWHRFGNIKCDDYLEMHLEEVYPNVADDYWMDNI